MIIPHLNVSDGLNCYLSALDAERKRSEVNFCVVVVDNGSIQLSGKVCAIYPFVQLFVEAKPGPARNHGVRAATTDILALIDADCTANPGWVSTILSHFRDHPDTSVIGGEVYIDPVEPTAIKAYESVFAYHMCLYYNRENYTGTGNMAVWREAFEKVGDFAGISMAEGRDCGHRATALGLRSDFVPEMAIRTPARANFPELARKWDRQLGHQFDEVDSFLDRIRWVLKTLALTGSPVVEVVTILRSDKLSRPHERWLALGVFVRIRLYRCRRMLGLLVGAGPSSLSVWRRS